MIGAVREWTESGKKAINQVLFEMLVKTTILPTNDPTNKLTCDWKAYKNRTNSHSCDWLRDEGRDSNLDKCWMMPLEASSWRSLIGHA